MIKSILLAEDDEDDFLLFHEAIKEFKNGLKLDWVKDGEELITELGNDVKTPDMVFLDINMPRKNGFECLTEIRQDQKWKQLPVVIYSTSKDKALVNWMYNSGANLYLCKPSEFQQLKTTLQTVINMDWKTRTTYPPFEQFLIG